MQKWSNFNTKLFFLNHLLHVMTTVQRRIIYAEANNHSGKNSYEISSPCDADLPREMWNNNDSICYQLSLVFTITVYPKKYAHGFVVLCFVVVMQSFIMNSHEAFIHIHQGCFAGTGAIVRLPQCQWSKPDGYGIISQCITTTKHSKAKTECIFLGIYCIRPMNIRYSVYCVWCTESPIPSLT